MEPDFIWLFRVLVVTLLTKICVKPCRKRQRRPTKRMDWIFLQLPKKNIMTYSCKSLLSLLPALVLTIGALTLSRGAAAQEAATGRIISDQDPYTWDRSGFTATGNDSLFHMAVRSNVLYDVIYTPNVGLEFYLTRRWSIGGSFYYAEWDDRARNRSWRTRSFDLFVRRYFSSNETWPFSGLHAGVYGLATSYDIQLGNRGFISDRYDWGAGIEFGYGLPVAKRFNVDFNVGLAYLWGTHHNYAWCPERACYQYASTRPTNFLLPKAEISLVWEIGKGFKRLRRANPDNRRYSYDAFKD